MSHTDDSTPDPPLTNIPFERAVLGACVRSPAALAHVTETLQVDDFYSFDAQTVFAALLSTVDQGNTVDPQLLARQLRHNGNLSDPVGVLADMVSVAALTSRIEAYTDDLRTCSDARKIQSFARTLAGSMEHSDGNKESIQTTIQEADTELWALTDRIVTTPWNTIGEFSDQMGDTGIGVEPTVFTGIPELDTLLMGGFRPGQMVIIAARPGQGKTTFAVDIARNSSIKHGVPGLMISLEMSGPELVMRIMSAESGVPLSSIKQGKVLEDDLAVLDAAKERFVDCPFRVIDQIEPTLPPLVAVIRKAVRRLGIKYVIIDYAQLLSGDGTNNPSREQQMANVSRTLKTLARRLQIVVIVVAQLNRGPEQRADKKPQISDLRESGQFEQDADIVLLLFRPEIYDPLTERAGEIDIHSAKHRDGETGVITAGFQGALARVVPLSHEEEPGNWASSSARS